MTLSSSVAAEAPMFDKSALQLITPDLHALPAEMVSRFHRVDARATSLAFWGDIIDAMPSFMFLDTPPPPLRQRFSVRWGYTPDMTAPLSRRIAEGEVVSFAKGGRGQDLCLFGWSEPNRGASGAMARWRCCASSLRRILKRSWWNSNSCPLSPIRRIR